MAKKLKIAKVMTPEMAANYITNGGENCPFCNEEGLTGESFDVEGKFAAQEMGCDNCNQAWIDGWRRISVTHNGEIYEPSIDKLRTAKSDALQELFRKLTSTNYVEVGDLLSAIKLHIAEVSTDATPPESYDLEKCHNGLIPELAHDTTSLCSNCNDVLWAECQLKKRTRESADV